MSIEKADLGSLSPQGEGSSGQVFSTLFRLPGDLGPLVYKKFTRDRASQQRAVAAVVSFRKNLSEAERAYLDEFTRWPRELVKDRGYTTGFLLPTIPAEYRRVSRVGALTLMDRLRTLDWLAADDIAVAIATDVPRVERGDRIDLLTQLCRTIAFLHEHGWVFGDLSLSSVAFTPDGPRTMLLDCEGAASLSDRDRAQEHSPGWAPPESASSRPQDDHTDVYKLGLAILRALTPGKGATTAQDPARLQDVLNPAGVALIARALSPTREVRPSARELADYLEQEATRRRTPPATIGTPTGTTEGTAPPPTAAAQAPPLPAATPPPRQEATLSPDHPVTTLSPPDTPVTTPSPPDLATQTTAPSAALDPLQHDDPTSVGPYRLQGRLGAGGMGEVFLGRSPGGRMVAVKLIYSEHSADPEFRARFAREVEAATRVNGFYTAQVVDADPAAPRPWLATAYIQGPSLASAVRERGPLTPAEARELGAALAEGLIAIHKCGLVHRDLKPGNIILAADGPRIIDFGIARALDATRTLTPSGTLIGTLAYMSPEQMSGHPVGPASDVFSLGSVLTYAATRHGPFDAPWPAVMHRLLMEDPDLAGLPATLHGLVTACLQKNPEHRPTLQHLLAELGG